MQKTVSIKLNKEFRSLYYRGGSEVTDLLVLYFKKNGFQFNRLGLTVSKKVGNAVTRNRVRRLIKENFRIREEKIKNGYDLVFVARGKSAFKGYLEIGNALDKLLAKSGLYK